MRKKLIAILIVCCLVAPILFQNPLKTEAATDQYGFNTETPSDFHANDGANPYGKGKTALNPIMEPFIFRSASGSMNVDYWNDVDMKKGVNKGTQVNIDSKNKECAADFVVSKAYDPDGSGHDYMVAMVGLQNEDIVVWSYNTRTKEQSEDYSIDVGGGDNSDWFDKIEQWEYTSFFNLTAGDFNGDGKDEIAVYVPQRGNPYVRILKANANGTFEKLQDIQYQKDDNDTSFMPGARVSGTFTNDGRTERAMVQASLEAVDLDRDGTDELAILGSFADLHDDSDTEKITDRSSRLAIFRWDGGESATWKDLVQWGDTFKMKDTSSSNIYMRTASCAAGDIDNNGFEELVVAGYFTTSGSSDDLDDDEFAITTISYNKNTGEMGMGTMQKLKMNRFVEDGLYTGDTVQAPPALVCAAVNGRNDKEKVFLEGTMYSYDNRFIDSSDNLPEDQQALLPHTYSKYEESDNGINSYIISNTYVETAVAGNFDGNDLGIEQVIYTTGYKQQSRDYYFYNVNVMGKTVVKDETGDNIIYKANDKYYDNHWEYVHYHRDADNNLFVSIAAVDADDDTTTMEFASKEYTYTNVDVLAVLQAAPYFEDLKDDYPDNTGGTTFGKTTGEGQGSTTTTTASVGAYVSADFKVAPFLSMSTEASFTHDWEWEYEEQQTQEYSISFEGGFMEDTVVLYRTPVVLYHYNVTAPEGNTSGNQNETSQMTIGIQEKPVYSTMELDQYNELASNDPNMQNKVIGSDIISSTPGQPSTYFSSSAGLSGFVGAPNDNVASAGSSTSQTSQSIVVGQEQTSSQSYSNTFELSVGVSGGVKGIGEFGGGVTAGGGWGGGTSTVNYSSIEKTGTVATPPAADYPYSFHWLFGTWRAELDGDEIPVLGYLVYNVVEPPSLPEDIAVEEVTQNSMKIHWSHGARRPASYEIYQYFEDSVADDGYSLITTVDGVTDNFTYENLEAGQEYSLAIRSVGTDENGNRTASPYSPLVTGVTLRGNSKLTVNSMTEVQNVSAGGTAYFTVDATPSQGVTAGLTYSWQVKEAGTANWKNYRTESSTLTLENVTKEMDGNQYRCVVSEIQNGIRSYVYSKAGTLNVGKAESTVTVTAKNSNKDSQYVNTNTGNANYLESSEQKNMIDVVRTVTVTTPPEKTGGDSVTDTYQVFANTYTPVEGDNPDPAYIYQSNSNNQYYVLEGLSLEDATGTATARILLNEKQPYYAVDENGTNPIEGLTPDELYGEQQTYEIQREDSSSKDDIIEYLVWQEVLDENDDGEIISSRNVYTLKDTPDDKFYSLVNGAMVETSDVKKTNLQPLYSSSPGTETISGTEYEVWYWQQKNGEGGSSEQKLYQRTENDVRHYYQKKVTEEQTAMEEVYLIQPDTLTGSGESTEYTVQHGPTAVVDEVEQITTVDTNKDGDSVILTANVGAEGNKSIAGKVTFQIVNNQTGSVTTASADITGTGSGSASVTWVPTAAGDYTITATFSGNDVLNVSSNTAAYYAVDGPKSEIGYVLDSNPDNITYGQGAALTVKEVKKKDGKPERDENGNIVLQDLAEGTPVSYQAQYEKDGTIETDNLSSPNFNPAMAGTYTLTATIGTYTAKTTINVQKRPITITAPTATGMSSSSEEKLPEMKDVTITYRGTDEESSGSAILSTDWSKYVGTDNSELAKIFRIVTSPNLDFSSGAGNYTTSLEYLTQENSSAYVPLAQEFLSKYDVKLEKGLYNLVAGVKNVTYEVGVNGTLEAYFGDNKAAFASGANITEGNKLTFVAYPNENFQVEEWKVTDANGQDLAKDQYTISGNQLIVDSLKDDIHVKVTFEPAFYRLGFSADEHGSVTAHYLTDGEPDGAALTSSGNVASGKSIRLTAKPEEGYVVEQWKISRNNGELVVQKNADGSDYSRNTLDIDAMDSNMNIEVSFVSAGNPFTIETAVVDADGASLAGGSISVSGEGLITGGTEENPQLTAIKGSELTFTAKDLSQNIIVREWRVYENYTEGSQNYKVVSGNAPSYTVSNVQSNLRVEIVAVAMTEYQLTYQVKDEDNNVVTAETGAPILTATWKKGSDNQSLKSGAMQTAYIPVTFDVNLDNLDDQYQIKEWAIQTGTEDETSIKDAVGKDATSWTLSSLSDNTVVTVYVEKRPTLTYSPTADDENVNGEISCKELDSGAYLDKYRTDEIELTISPDKGYEIDTITVKEGDVEATDETASETITYTKSAIENSADTLLTVIPGSEGFKENVTVEVTFKTIIPCVDVEYSLHDLGDGTYGKMTASVDRLGDEDYKEPAGGEPTPVESGTLTSVYRDSVVTFKVTPDKGYVVGKWSVNGTEVTENIRTDKTANDTFAYTITAEDTTPVRVVAQLEQVGNKLTFGAESVLDKEVAGGTVTAFNNQTQKAFYSGNTLTADSSITFTAQASEGYELTGWKVNDELVANEKGNTFKTTVEADSLTNVKAVFDRVPYTVTWSAEGGTVEVKNTTDDAAVTSGSQVRGGRELTFTATPEKGMEFKGWTVTGAEVTDEQLTASPLTLKLENNVTVKAAFAKKSDYTVTFESNDETMGTVTATAGLETQQAIASGDSVPSNHRVIFTAVPKDGYLVEGWYSSEEEMNKEDGKPIEGTKYEQTEYTLDALEDNTTVYVKFEKIPSYDITIGQNGKGEGSLKVFLNDKEVNLNDGKISAPRHSKVSVTATPKNEYSLFTAWNGETSTSDIYTIEDVTEATSITATFSTAEVVTVCFDIPEGIDASDAEVTVGSGDDYEAYRPVGAVNTGVQVIRGKNVRFSITPPEGKMIDTWIVTYENGSVDPDAGSHGLDNVMMLDNLEKSATVTVTLKDIKAYEIPEAKEYDIDADGSPDYTIDNLVRIPDTLPDAEAGGEDYTNKVRENGDVTLTVTPAEGKWIKDIRLAEEEESGETMILRSNSQTETNILKSTKNEDGSWDVTVSNITRDIKLLVETGNYYTLTIDNAKNGSITARDSAGNAIVNGGRIMEGDSITLTAAPAKHYRLAAWGGDAAGAGTASGNAAEITLKNIESDIRVSAEFAMTEHTNTEIRGAKDATCTEDGYTGDTYCKDCGTLVAKGKVIKALGHTYTSKVTQEATTRKAGVITYTCSRCGYTYTESIEALPKPIVPKPLKAGRNKIRLSWNKVKGADGYIIYAETCNTTSKKKEKTVKKVKTVVSANRSTWTHKKLKSNTWYKYQIKAFEFVNGKRVVLSTTPILHAVTSGDSRYANPVKVKVQKAKVSVKAGKKKKIKASVVIPQNKICRWHCDKIRYIVEDTKIATVNKKGVIKAKKKGKTVVYAIAQNGVNKKITVTVK